MVNGNPSSDDLEHVSTILQHAHSQGRDILFEYEVYQILALLTLNFPRHFLINDPLSIDDHLLSRFGNDTVVMKAVSADVTHKQKAGGVQMVYKDAAFVRYAFERMRERFERDGLGFEGVLLVERIHYTHELGNEILLGFHESETFGPVISFSKGGSDAEHFARHFSPPNLILAPIDRQWALALLESSHIHQKYLEEGRGHAVEMIVDAGVKLSDLAMAFSNYFDGSRGFVFKEFEINPFVFTSQGQFIALDGFARFDKRALVDDTRRERIDASGITPFFEPRGIAVVGVSASDPLKVGNIILRNLMGLQRTDVYAVNPKGGVLEDRDVQMTLHPSVEAIEAAVDLAVVAVPADHALPVVEDCARKGVKAVILIPGGFSEVNRNRDVETRILKLARNQGFRVMGPNCLGIIYAV